jgi:AraC-like DNA-binding protein
MADDVYEEMAPPPRLTDFVLRLWTYSAEAPSGAVQRIVPDGCCELIVHLGAPYEELGADGTWRRQPEVLFAGQLTRPLVLRPTGPVHVIAARFRPDGARPFLGRSLREATDRRVDLTDEIGEPPRTLAQLADWLDRQREHEAWSLDPVVRSALTAQPADLDPAAQRALQRAFLDRVGVSAQTLRSIHRFRQVFERAEHLDGAAGQWLKAGLEAGYFDQPHIARDFRRFLGCTATDWARQQSELARALSSESYKTVGEATV